MEYCDIDTCVHAAVSLKKRIRCHPRGKGDKNE